MVSLIKKTDMEYIADYTDINEDLYVRPSSSSFDRRILLTRGPSSSPVKKIQSKSNSNCTSTADPEKKKSQRRGLKNLLKYGSRGKQQHHHQSSTMHDFDDSPTTNKGLQSYLSYKSPVMQEIRPPRRNLNKSWEELNLKSQSSINMNMNMHMNMNSSRRTTERNKMGNHRNNLGAVMPSTAPYVEHRGPTDPSYNAGMGIRACTGLHPGKTAKRMVKNTDVDSMCGMGTMFM